MNPFIWKLIHLYIRELLYPILLFPTNRSNISNREESHFIFSSDRFVQISLKISLIKEILLEYEIFKKKEESKGLEILDVDSIQRFASKSKWNIYLELTSKIGRDLLRNKPINWCLIMNPNSPMLSPLPCCINPLRVLITFEMYAHARRHNGS